MKKKINNKMNSKQLIYNLNKKQKEMKKIV